jgi:hypothetical protein
MTGVTERLAIKSRVFKISLREGMIDGVPESRTSRSLPVSMGGDVACALQLGETSSRFPRAQS